MGDPLKVSTDDVRYLLAVARTGRIVAAASALAVDHATVRRRIARLESALGVRVLDRGADGWELTEVGREIAERAAGLEQLVEDVLDAATGDVEGVRGTVRVVAPEGFGTAFVTPVLARLQRANPRLRVELVTSTRPLGARGAGFDLAVTVGSAQGSRLSSEVLAPYALRLYAAPAYLDAHGPIEDVAQLGAHPLVFYVDALLTVAELDLVQGLGGMRVGFGSTNVFAQLEATRRGAGIGLLHAFLAERDTGLVPVLPHAVDFRLHFGLALRREAQSSEAALLVREALREEVRERAGELVPPSRT